MVGCQAVLPVGATVTGPRSSPSEPTGSLGDEFLKKGDEVKMLNPYEAMAEVEEGVRELATGAENGADDNGGPCEEFEATDGGGFIPKGYAESVLLRTFRRFSSIPAVVIAGINP